MIMMPNMGSRVALWQGGEGRDTSKILLPMFTVDGRLKSYFCLWRVPMECANRAGYSLE